MDFRIMKTNLGVGIAPRKKCSTRRSTSSKSDVISTKGGFVELQMVRRSQPRLIDHKEGEPIPLPPFYDDEMNGGTGIVRGLIITAVVTWVVLIVLEMISK